MNMEVLEHSRQKYLNKCLYVEMSENIIRTVREYGFFEKVINSVKISTK